MPRLYPVAGTKEIQIGRRALTFSHANYGPVIIDGIRPEDGDMMMSRLWALYGRGNIWQKSRRMMKDEQYVELDVDRIAS